MVYTPSTDFVGLWRNSGSNVSKLEMPGLDFVIAALARAGIITVVVSATAPVANQNVTAWFKTAVPSNSAEGQFFLWNAGTSAYLPATPALFLAFLEASAGQTGTSWYATVGGPPLNTVGNNGDFAIRTDEPGGIFGPKAAGAWPASPIAGTTDLLTSTTLDLTFGGVKGNLIYRGTAVWQALVIGAPNALIASVGSVPTWESLSTLMDAVFGSTQGSILYRDVALWNAIGPGATGQILSTNGVGSNPSWVPRTAEFPSGTNIVFQQTAAPTGWTKQTALNDYGLRVTSGVAGTTAGTPFSTIFAQTAVGNTTVTVATMPSHSHVVGGAGQSPLYNTGGGGVGGGGAFGVQGTFTINNTGSDGPHTHSVNLALSYVDVILASKN